MCPRERIFHSVGKQRQDRVVNRHELTVGAAWPCDRRDQHLVVRVFAPNFWSSLALAVLLRKAMKTANYRSD